MVVPLPPARLRSQEIYREVTVVSMEITILLSAALLLYTSLIILQHIFCNIGILLFMIATVALLITDQNTNRSLPVNALLKLKEIVELIAMILVCITSKVFEEGNRNNYSGSETKCSGMVGLWAGYVAYAGLLVQVFLRYPLSLDTFFAGGFIVIAISANHAFLFSCLWGSMKKKTKKKISVDINKDDELEIEEVKAKYDEDRERWEEEKRDLIEQLNATNAEAAKLRERVSYSMFGHYDWD